MPDTWMPSTVPAGKPYWGFDLGIIAFRFRQKLVLTNFLACRSSHNTFDAPHHAEIDAMHHRKG